MDELKSAQWPVLILDAGDMLYRATQLPPDSKKSSQAKADVIIEVQKKIGIDAANVGYKDLALGLNYIEKKESNGFPWVSANLRTASGGKVKIPEYRILNAGDVKVGIFGLLDDQGMPKAGEKSQLDYAVTDSFKAAEETVRKLKEKGADVVVLLSGMTYVRNKELADKVSGINFIVSGGDARLMITPEKEKETVILAAFSRGKYVGVAHVGYLPGSVYFRLEGEGNNIQGQLALNASQKRIFEGEAASLPEVRQKLDEISNEEKQMEARLANMNQSASIVKNRMVGLEPGINGRRDIVQILEEAKKAQQSGQ